MIINKDMIIDAGFPPSVLTIDLNRQPVKSPTKGKGQDDTEGTK